MTKKNDFKYVSEETVRRVQAGDLEAFGEMYELHCQFVVNYAAKYSDYTTAEDIAHDVWIKVWNKLHMLKTPKAYFNWIRTLVQRTCIEAWKSKARRPLLSETIPHWIEGTEIDPLENLILAEEEALLRRCRRKLDQIYRDVLNLRLKGHTYAEISKKLKISQVLVKRRIHAGTKKLLKIAERELTNG